MTDLKAYLSRLQSERKISSALCRRTVSASGQMPNKSMFLYRWHKAARKSLGILALDVYHGYLDSAIALRSTSYRG